MATYFLDTSAIIKRYIFEQGQAWIDADSRFSTYAARNDGWDIPGKNVDSPPLHMPFEVCPGILVPSSSPDRLFSASNRIRYEL